MKTLTKIALAVLTLATSFSTQADWVRGHFRSNGTYVAPYYRSSSGSFSSYPGYASPSREYVYRNPYAATPSVNVREYFRSDGTCVLPHVRTAPNRTELDNLSYRGYGTTRVPRNPYGW